MCCVVLQPYNTYIQPGQQVSLQYTFQPAAQVPIQEWQLSLTAYFWYAHTHMPCPYVYAVYQYLMQPS